jgi:hypothetical protein
MSTAAEAVISLLNTSRGQRPYSMENQETEQCFAVTLAMAVELIATNDRVDRLERQLAQLSGKPLEEVRRAGDDASAQQERLAANEATLLRTLRVLIDPRPAVDQRPHARSKT